MNILHVTQNYFPSQGGTQYMMQKLSETFKEQYEDSVKVFTSNSYFGPGRSLFKEITPPFEIINGIDVFRFPYLRTHKPILRFVNSAIKKTFKKELPFYLNHTLQSGPVSYPLFKAMLNTPAEVIGASSMHYLFADYPQWRKYGKHPKPFVLYGALHIRDGYTLNKRYINRINKAEYFIANTSFEKDFILKYIDDADKIKVIGTATDIYKDAYPVKEVELYKKSIKINQNKKLILYIGRHEDWKGIPVLTNAFIQLQKDYPDAKLVIAGAATSYTTILEKLAYENPAILVLSNISHKEKCLLLQAADMLVLPSAEESFGVVFLEAWSFKKPVIGVNIGAVASVVEHNKDGLLFEKNNVASLYKTMEALLNSVDKRINLGNAGYEKLMQNYTWQKVAPAFRNVYELAIEKFNSNKK